MSWCLRIWGPLAIVSENWKESQSRVNVIDYINGFRHRLYTAGGQLGISCPQLRIKWNNCMIGKLSTKFLVHEIKHWPCCLLSVHLSRLNSLVHIQCWKKLVEQIYTISAQKENSALPYELAQAILCVQLRITVLDFGARCCSASYHLCSWYSGGSFCPTGDWKQSSYAQPGSVVWPD